MHYINDYKHQFEIELDIRPSSMHEEYEELPFIDRINGKTKEEIETNLTELVKEFFILSTISYEIKDDGEVEYFYKYARNEKEFEEILNSKYFKYKRMGYNLLDYYCRLYFIFRERYLDIYENYLGYIFPNIPAKDSTKFAITLCEKFCALLIKKVDNIIDNEEYPIKNQNQKYFELSGKKEMSELELLEILLKLRMQEQKDLQSKSTNIIEDTIINCKPNIEKELFKNPEDASKFIDILKILKDPKVLNREGSIIGGSDARVKNEITYWFLALRSKGIFNKHKRNEYHDLIKKYIPNLDISEKTLFDKKKHNRDLQILLESLIGEIEL